MSVIASGVYRVVDNDEDLVGRHVTLMRVEPEGVSVEGRIQISLLCDEVAARLRVGTDCTLEINIKDE